MEMEFIWHSRIPGESIRGFLYHEKFHFIFVCVTIVICDN